MNKDARKLAHVMLDVVEERGETAMNRPTFHDFKKKALSDPDVRAEYESLSAAYHLEKINWSSQESWSNPRGACQETPYTEK